MTDTTSPQDRKSALAAYMAVTAAYWAFMLTDGALRMLVLLHFHTLGFSPVHLAYLFLLYEFMGVVTNLAAGWIAARFWLTTTLYAGLGFQIAALVALSQGVWLVACAGLRPLMRSPLAFRIQSLVFSASLLGVAVYLLLRN